MKFSLIVLLSGLSLAGCADYPNLQSAVSRQARNAPYPSLVPVDPLLDAAAQRRITPATGAGLQARADRLARRARRIDHGADGLGAAGQARAEALRRRAAALRDMPVLDKAERDRLSAAAKTAEARPPAGS
ncbi:hypothetical protein [Brevirhabdus sp.]|uniref:hypothetical protein n=1 Tax=Brevirhabdus sp. TaxID=2004514 RepID=UPI00405849BA